MIKIIIIIICLVLFVSSTNSTIKSSRDLKKEIIECSDEQLDCKQISADRISNTTCSCIGGTFYYSDDGQLKCVMGSGLFASKLYFHINSFTLA